MFIYKQTVEYRSEHTQTLSVSMYGSRSTSGCFSEPCSGESLPARSPSSALPVREKVSIHNHFRTFKITKERCKRGATRCISRADNVSKKMTVHYLPFRTPASIDASERALISIDLGIIVLETVCRKSLQESTVP